MDWGKLKKYIVIQKEIADRWIGKQADRFQKSAKNINMELKW